MRLMLVVAGMVMVAATAAYAEEWPLRLEEIWVTPGKDEPAFAEGFPPPEIKAVVADTSIPQEDKEWLLNQIRHWAAYRTQKLWLDDGSTMEIPAVKPGDKVRTFTVYASRNMKYWLVRVMRIEGPEISPEPTVESVEEAKDPAFWEQIAAHSAAQWAQKARWREVYMDVEGRIYWEKEFGPYDTHLEDSWIGDVGVYISDDGEVVVKTRRPAGMMRPGMDYVKQTLVCDSRGNCEERRQLVGARMSACALSADGSKFVLVGGSSSETHLLAYAPMGEELYRSKPIPGEVGDSPLLQVAEDGGSAVFAVARPQAGGKRDCEVYFVGNEGANTYRYSRPGERPIGACLSRDGTVLAVAFDRSLVVAETRTGRVLWHYEAEDEWRGKMWSLAMPGDGSLVALSAISDWARRPYPGELFLFSRDSALHARITARVSDPSFSPRGEFLCEKSSGAMTFHRVAR